MQTKPLTKIQQGWLDHVNQATKLKLSMSAYAKQKNLALKAFYNARTALIKKGILPAITDNPLIAVTITSSTTPKATASCRMTLPNGVSIEFTDTNIDSLLNAASRL